MRVLFATAELAPLARVGGLAEAASGLIAQLREPPFSDQVDVEVVLPDYGGIELADETTESIAVPRWAGPATLRRGIHPVVGQVTLVATAGTRKPHPYIDRDGQGWPDNDLRFYGFAAAIGALADASAPDLVHLNDWHTAAAVGFMSHRRPTVLTIHTLGYQGFADAKWFARIPYHHSAFEWYDVTNPLAAGIRMADKVIAVSPTYAAEILTDQHGAGLQHDLMARGEGLVGIRNGIDVAQWNPATDPLIAANYTATDTAAAITAAKRKNRAALLARFEVPNIASEPVIGVVSRLVDQKGIDMLAESAPFLERLGARVVVLGSGDRWLADWLHWLHETTRGRVVFYNGYDGELAHQIFAGSDLFVMPSRFEPCGLAQMQAMAYGTLPIVTDLGGLHDTVIDADDDPERGTGILAVSPSPQAITDALHRGVRLWRDPKRRLVARANGMAPDWSWIAPAHEHLEIYRTLIG